MANIQLRRERSPFFLDSMFEDLDRVFEGFAAPVARQGAAYLPTYELVEDEKGYLLSFDLPGVPKEDIQIEVKDQQLRVWGERKQTEEKTEGRRTYTERRYGKFERIFTLPSDMDAEKVQAHYDNGVLHLMLPRTEKVQAKKINIEAGPTGFFNKLVGGEKKGVQ